ncbi:hypothetical protein PVK06_036965 [Gossypium arboreum]|uniref:Uncharacterized protein n=1 Tax=Gossypium arboreum TaxID=29729 RepID=A0ABR0NP26_GOSAR|nr:hypothetical protein PVK06_036965 [Gossypium arboreum]
MTSISGNKSIVMRRVFAEGLDCELLMIKEAILRYPFVFIDTKFSGTIFKPSKDFDINPDHYASDSIELLKRQGIDFEKNKEKGIDSKDFTKKFWDDGLVFNCYGLKSITWITFHDIYDLGFMLKILT